ncbi:hypothetical protein D3OALGA1CA_2202 [Olavius algarvensis associated proteobacterium Delta 3]|nr:hypothetical protein D3OALGB2SA_2157 [Olavius algarvensis associated proteobacterium Delta 3]CAB5114925.1 hypothetical protein D3OALGA1CA_2202 [Olavius algarvensis associated proteobacterium Delta 3]
MLLKQAELFWGLSHECVEQVMAHIFKASHPAGDVLFEKGAPADHFYTLLKGRVKLTIGENGRMVFVVSHAGESFGWSSLVDRDTYSATAECVADTTVLTIERSRFNEILAAYPGDAVLFLKRLAGMLGRRLLQSYQMIQSFQQVEEAPTQGTGQISKPVATV